MAELTLTLDDPTVERLMALAASRDMTLQEATSFVLGRTLFGVDKKIPATLQEYKPQHIPVMIDETADDVLKNYRCNNCGNIVFQYYGSVKLVTHGIYNAKNMQIEGEERPWSEPLGKPTVMQCEGRVMPDGYKGKVRCGYVYYKIGS